MSNSYYEMKQMLAKEAAMGANPAGQPVANRQERRDKYMPKANTSPMPGGQPIASRQERRDKYMPKVSAYYENLYYFDKEAKAKKIVSTLFGPKVKYRGKMQYKWKADAEKAGRKFKKDITRKTKKALPKIKKGAKKAAPYAAAAVGGAGMHSATMKSKAKKDAKRIEEDTQDRKDRSVTIEYGKKLKHTKKAGHAMNKSANEIADAVLYKLANPMGKPMAGAGAAMRANKPAGMQRKAPNLNALPKTQALPVPGMPKQSYYKEAMPPARPMAGAGAALRANKPAAMQNKKMPNMNALPKTQALPVPGMPKQAEYYENLYNIG